MIRRKDTKGRVLNDGEIQRSDGRYAYQYQDAIGERRTVYSWKLLPGDAIPKGKRKDISLREKEQQIQTDLQNQIKTFDGNITIAQLLDKYFAIKKERVNKTTAQQYQYTIIRIKKQAIAQKKVNQIKKTEIKQWVIEMYHSGLKTSTISGYKNILKPAFNMAMEDNIILKNPFDFKISDILPNDSTKRKSLTEEEEKRFMDFIQNSNVYRKYYDAVFVLFHTGLRISEFLGLTIRDIDFKARKFKINHQLKYTTGIGYWVDTPKSETGIREIPMTDEVCECFKRVLEKRKKYKTEIMIDGYSGFIFLSPKGKLQRNCDWDKIFNRMRDKYNRTHDIPLPTITPHICRHTFCSRMAMRGINLKALQYLMGHSDISITMDIYTHAHYDEVEREFFNALQSNPKYTAEFTSNSY